MGGFDLEGLNMELRKIILEHTLNLEHRATSIITYALGIIKDDSKTLGNKGSSLSFKTKIDILYDLDELDKKQYIDLVKQMEIRNQFIHNAEVSTFIELQETYPDLISYLINRYPNEESQLERKYATAYLDLYAHCSSYLIKIEQEFRAGLAKAYDRFIDHSILSDIESLFREADRLFLIDANYINSQLNGKIDTEVPGHVASYKTNLQHAIAIKSADILKTIEGEEGLRKVLTKKVALKDQFKEKRRKQRPDSSK